MSAKVFKQLSRPKFDQVRLDVEEHFRSVNTALLLCELLPLEGEDLWVENSRGFVLPPVWDPKTLMTGGPRGMKNSSEHGELGELKQNEDPPSKWSNQRRKYSERLADTARQLAPSLESAGVHATVPQRFSEELTHDHLVDYVLFAKERRRSADPSRFQRRLSLRTALEEAEASERGRACRLVAASLALLAQQTRRSDGHFILELLVKPSEQGLAPSECSVTFCADAAAMEQLMALGLSGSLCLRLAVKFAARFCFSPQRLPADQVPLHFQEAVASADRSRLAGLIEYLAASCSLELDDERLPIDEIVSKLTMPPADGTILELVCQHVPSMCQDLSAILTSTGQLKLARKIEARRLRGYATPETNGVKFPEASSNLPKLCLPPSVQIMEVADMKGLARLHQRLQGGGVVGLDAEWKPCGDEGFPTSRARRGQAANPVQRLACACCTCR